MNSEFNFYDDSGEFFGGKGFIIRVPKNIASKRELCLVYAQKTPYKNNMGKNWDALSDVLRDLSWVTERDVSIVHRDLPFDGDDESLWVYLDILRFAINHWKAFEEHELHVIFPESDRTKIVDLMAAPRID